MTQKIYLTCSLHYCCCRCKPNHRLRFQRIHSSLHEYEIVPHSDLSIFWRTLSNTHFCRIRNGGGAGHPLLLPPVIFEGRNLPQQTIYHWKGKLSKSPIHFRYRQNILISRLYEHFLRNDSTIAPEKNSDF